MGDVDTTGSKEPKASEYAPCTRAIHADDGLNAARDVTPPLHVSTTFRYADDPNDLVPASDAVVRLPHTPLTPTAGNLTLDF